MNFTDDQIYQALVSQIANNPTGASAIDVLSGLGLYQEITEALQRLVKVGKLKEVSPGNYLPLEQS